MIVEIPYLNSIDVRKADNPIGTTYDGYSYVKKFSYEANSQPRVQIWVNSYSEDVTCKAYVKNEQGRKQLVLTNKLQITEGVLVFDIVCVNRWNGVNFLHIELEDKSGDFIMLLSEPFCFKYGDEFKNSIINIECTNSENDFGIIFSPSEYWCYPFCYVVEGEFYPKSLTPKSKDVVYVQQDGQQSTLYSMPSETYRLTMGGVAGIPDEFIKKLNRVLSCDNIKINGKQYTKAEGAELASSDSDNYPFRSWTIELQEVKEPFDYEKVEYRSDVEYVAKWQSYVCTIGNPYEGRNAGDATATEISLEKIADGVTVSGYPVIYSLLSAFGSYPSITTSYWQNATTEYRDERANAFITYLNSPLDISIQFVNQAYKTDVVMCPIPPDVILYDGENIFLVDGTDAYLTE